MSIFVQPNAKEDEERLKHVLIADKHFNPERIKQVIKSDIYHVLLNYAHIKGDDIYVDIEITQSGSYHIKVDAISPNLKIFGALPDE